MPSEYAINIAKDVFAAVDVPVAQSQVEAAAEAIDDRLQRRVGGVKHVKYLDLAAFGRIGFLQEVNRQFFHPHGLALEITCDDDDYTNAVITGIWDYRDDPEGMIFADGMIDPEKIAAVDQERRRHWTTRANMFQSDNVWNTYADVQPRRWVEEGTEKNRGD